MVESLTYTIAFIMDYLLHPSWVGGRAALGGRGAAEGGSDPILKRLELANVRLNLPPTESVGGKFLSYV